MDILIKNIKMPKSNEGVFLTLTKEGLFEWDENKLEYVKDYNLVELPPHGDLIDRNETIQCVLDKKFSTSRILIDSVLNVIKDAPTILEASNGRTD